MSQEPAERFHNKEKAMKSLVKKINRNIGQNQAKCHEAVSQLAAELSHPAVDWAYYPQGDEAIMRVMSLSQDTLDSWELYNETEDLEPSLRAIIEAFFGRL